MLNTGVSIVVPTRSTPRSRIRLQAVGRLALRVAGR